MVGSTGPRVLAATLPWVDTWNTWFDWYGNTAEGFAKGNAEIDAASRAAGRDPAEVERSACVLVVLDRTAGERRTEEGVAPIGGSPEGIAGALRDVADAGADEAILVADPITESSIRTLGAVLAELDR
jgi:alkanesulfonate monooxygenase SsuD/methylene tetrahydromethanopterin reductase-like flavin-dependent oxidoreductase (luciferase family)